MTPDQPHSHNKYTHPRDWPPWVQLATKELLQYWGVYQEDMGLEDNLEVYDLLTIYNDLGTEVALLRPADSYVDGLILITWDRYPRYTIFGDDGIKYLIDNFPLTPMYKGEEEK